MRYLLYLLLNLSTFSLLGNGNVHNTTSRNMNFDKDQQAIQALLEQLFTAADVRDWETAKSLMAQRVYTDYSELGATPGFQTPEEIVAGWAALLPGFERTVHQIHNFAIWVAGDRATSTFDGIAVHYLQVANGDDYWTVFAGYDTEFIQENGEWKLARIDLSLYRQAGNEALPMAALERVQNGQAQDFASTSDAQVTVERFFSALESTDFEVFLENLSADAVQQMPLAPANFPGELDGKTALEQQYKLVMEYDQRYKRTYYPTQNPQVVLVKYQGTIKTESGNDYNNAYVSVFEVDDEGKILRNVEHFNPDILLASWTGLQPASYSVHDAGAARDGGVKMQSVSFTSAGVHLAGHLFLPPNFEETAQYPSVIVTGSWTSVKEQMPDEYASLLAQEGILALTFDFTGFGQSEGQPRQLEDYRLKINDIKAAVDFLSAHPNVQQTAITGVGVCASAGYMAHATAEDQRISKLVLIAPWLHNPAIAKSIYDMRPGGTEGLLQAAQAAKETYARTGKMTYVLAASELDPLSAMYVPENAFDYYLNPAKAAGQYYDNRFAVSSWGPWLTFDGIAAGSAIQQDVFVVHSEQGAVPHGAKAFLEEIPGNKEAIWLNEYNQQQLYHEKEAVTAAIEKVVNYLQGQ